MAELSSERGEPEFGKIRACVGRYGMSQSWFRRKVRSGELPYFRLPGGTILLRFADMDKWLQKYRIEAGQSHLDVVIDEMIEECLNGME